MADTFFAESEVDALTGLEERIQKAVTLVGTLRKERDTLTKDLAGAYSEIQRLTNELSAMREDRNQVRNRIEKLLEHIDQLSL